MAEIKEDLITALRKFEEDEIVRELEIRDTATHRSKIGDMRLFNGATLYVINELNQTVTVQLKGNWTRRYDGSVDIGASLDVTTMKAGAKTVHIAKDEWYPFMWCELSCSVAPTSGAVHVRLIKKPI